MNRFGSGLRAASLIVAAGTLLAASACKSGGGKYTGGSAYPRGSLGNPPDGRVILVKPRPRSTR